MNGACACALLLPPPLPSPRRERVGRVDVPAQRDRAEARERWRVRSQGLNPLALGWLVVRLAPNVVEFTRLVFISRRRLGDGQNPISSHALVRRALTVTHCSPPLLPPPNLAARRPPPAAPARAAPHRTNKKVTEHPGTKLRNENMSRLCPRFWSRRCSSRGDDAWRANT
jgi:hypothetical protein